MTFHALVVDDNPATLKEVKDRLESLGHTCDLAENQVDARRLLEKGRFSYALLDLEIPLRPSSLCRIDNGKNLLREIRTRRGFESLPIIVITSHGHDSPTLAVEVMKHSGAVDFVMKPFSESDPPLERVIEDALRVSQRDRPGAKSHDRLIRDPDPPLPFEKGEMIFSDSRIELCGIRIGDGADSGLMRSILDILQEKDDRGQFIALSGEELAERAGDAMTRQNDIADAIRRIRRRIRTALLNQLNVECGRDDVIVNDRSHGYRLSSKISISGEDEVVGCVDAAEDSHDDLTDRQGWILNAIADKGGLRKDEVLLGFKKQFGLSKTSLERDLKALRDRGLIRFDGEKRTGRWLGVPDASEVA